MSNMIFKRKVKIDNYTMIHNNILRNQKLSARAKGLMCYILSLPDDWTLNKQNLYAQFKEGKDALNTAWEELTESKYLNHYPFKDDSGKIVKWLVEVYEDPMDNPKFTFDDLEEPTPVAGFPQLDKQKPDAENPQLDTNADLKAFSPDADFPQQENPDSGNPQLQSTYIQSTDITKNLNNNNNNNYINNNAGARKKCLNKLALEIIRQEITTSKDIAATTVNQWLFKFSKAGADLSSATYLINSAIEYTLINADRPTIKYMDTIIQNWIDKSILNMHTLYQHEKNRESRNQQLGNDDLNLEQPSKPVPMHNWVKNLEKGLG